MSDMLPPPPYGPIVGHAPFRTAGRLRRPRVTAATGFRTSARSRSALPTAAYAPYFLHPKLLSVEHPLTSLPVPTARGAKTQDAWSRDRRGRGGAAKCSRHPSFAKDLFACQLL